MSEVQGTQEVVQENAPLSFSEMEDRMQRGQLKDRAEQPRRMPFDKGPPGDDKSKKAEGKEPQGKKGFAKPDQTELSVKAREARQRIAERKTEAEGKSQSKAEADKDVSGEVATEDVQAAVEEIKKIKAKIGDDEIELAANALFATVGEGGEKLEATLEDLLKDYKGREAIKKRFDEYSQKTAEFTKQKYQQDQYIKTFQSYMGEVMAQKNPLMALAVLHERLSGGDNPVSRIDAYKQFMEMGAEEFSRWNEMSDVERELHFTRMENEMLRNKDVHTAQLSQEQRRDQDLLNRVAQVEQELGIDRENFTDAYEKVLQLYKTGKLQLREGEIITPEHVRAYILDQRAHEKARMILTNLSDGLEQDPEIFNIVLETVYDEPDLTEPEIAEIVRDVFSAKVKKQVVNKTKDLRSTEQKSKKEPMWFSDL